MKLLNKTADFFTFELEGEEHAALQEVLRHYPVTPLAQHKVTRGKETVKPLGAQQLLDEAMLSHQQSLRQKVQTLLLPGRHFTKVVDKYHLSLREAEIEWLLQALNDVRVGYWIRLGYPEAGQLEEQCRTSPGAHFLMEAACCFELILLCALQAGDGNSLAEDPTDLHS